MTDFTPSDEQEQALAAMRMWHEREDAAQKPFVLSGLAGTGKTSLLPLLPSLFGVPVRMVAPTWKAASVLTEKMRLAGLPGRATSIHELIYIVKGIKHSLECAIWPEDPMDEPEWGLCDSRCAEIAFEYVPGKEPLPGVVVVDEASMVDEVIRGDLARMGVPVLYCGDHGQLPPIRGRSIFSEEAGVGFRLNTIQRQAAESPIIRMAWDIRQGGQAWKQEATWLEKVDLAIECDGLENGDTVLVAYLNKTVDKANSAVRRTLGRRSDLEPGDRIVVRDNDRARQVYNGQVASMLGPNYLEMQGGRRIMTARVRLAPSGLGDTDFERGSVRVNYGYALTCHRAQGSEWKRVLVWMDSERIGRKWLYTAVTRARDSVALRRG